MLTVTKTRSKVKTSAKSKSIITKITVNTVMKKLKSMANTKAKAALAKYGINPKEAFCISIPNLRSLAKDIGKNHSLALQLWGHNIREPRILASMIADPACVTKRQMNSWVREFDYWEICDQCCMNLFEKHKLAYQIAEEWSLRKGEFVKRAGFVLMARLAVSDKQAADQKFEYFFPFIVKESIDDRHMVKSAVNWALRQIGKRNLALNRKAIKVADTIQKVNSTTAKWIARDAIRELQSEQLFRRLANKK